MGRVLLSKAATERYVFGISWAGITDAKALEFSVNLLTKPEECFVYLYASGNEQILADQSLVYCKVIADQCRIERSAVDDRNTITAYFEQMA
jgi:hypothetical protein